MNTNIIKIIHAKKKRLHLQTQSIQQMAANLSIFKPKQQQKCSGSEKMGYQHLSTTCWCGVNPADV